MNDMAMMMAGEEDALDPMTRIGPEPDLKALHDEYNRAWSQDSTGLTRITNSENIRYCLWSGQSDDGLLHQALMPPGRTALPYDGASDTRVFFVDETVNFIVDILTAAFWGARINARPVTAAGLSTRQVAELRQVIEWMKNGPLKAQLTKQVEFAAQVAHGASGHVFLNPEWCNIHGLRLQKLSMDQVLQVAEQAGDQVPALAQLPMFIADPTLEQAAVDTLLELVPGIDKRDARRVVRELREDGNTEFPMPALLASEPKINVLVPWLDIVMPVETADPQDARMWTKRRYMTESQVEAMGSEMLPDEYRWNADFIAAAKRTAGQTTNASSFNELIENDENGRLIEILYTHTRGTDRHGVPGIYCTVWSAHLADGTSEAGLYGAHTLMDFADGDYQLVGYSTEEIGKRMEDARTVGEILNCAQTEIKRGYDGLATFTELSITPPLQGGLGSTKADPQFGPFQQNRLVAGSQAWAPLDLVGNAKPEVAFKLIEAKTLFRDNYFGFPRPDVHPARWAPRQQKMVNRWLLAWSECWSKLALLFYQNTTPEERYEILGRPSVLDASTLARHRVSLFFDVRSMDGEWVKELASNMNQFVMPLDRSGSVDTAPLVETIMSYFSPEIADRSVRDQEGASQAVYRQVMQDISFIMEGNQPLLAENDPAAAMKMQFAQQILTQNPLYMAAVQEAGPDGRPNPHFRPAVAENLKTYLENLQHNHQEMVVSKQQGRLGVQQVGNAPVRSGGKY